MLDKNTKRTAFLNYNLLYIFKICAFDIRFLVEDLSAMLCFLDGFGIAVPVFSYLETYNPVINCIITATKRYKII